MAPRTFGAARVVIGRDGVGEAEPVEPHEAERGIAVACASWWSSPWASTGATAPGSQGAWRGDHAVTAR